MKNEDATLLYTVRNNYGIFRLAVESALLYLPRDHYKEILIVDDQSNDQKTIDFLQCLDSDVNLKVRVVKTGEPNDLGYYNHIERGLKGCSFGHGESINFGLKHVSTHYVCVLDSDTMILPKGKDIIKNIIDECFSLDEKIMAVGQCSGKVDGIQVFQGNKDEEYYKNRGVPKNSLNQYGGWGAPFLYYKSDYSPHSPGGFPPCAFMICSMDSWQKYKLNGFSNGGWAQATYIYNLFRCDDNLKTCNYNVFKDGYVLHIGFSTVRTERRAFNRTLGFVSGAGVYGSVTAGEGRLNDWYAGYYSVTVTMEELFEILEREYGEFPFNERKSIIHTMISDELK